MSPRDRASVSAIAALLCSACLGGGSVTRVVDGRLEEGRPVGEEAYAATLRAGILDASGDRDRALEELERALAADPDSPELLTRYGEVACRPGRESPPRPGQALGAFSRALNLDSTYAPAWLGRARCLELLGRTREALLAAQLAVEGDPLAPEATKVVARLLFALGREREAWAWLDGLVTLSPDSVEAERALLAAARDRHDEIRARAARRRLAARGVAVAGSAGEALSEAVRAGDLAAARRAAVDLRLSSSALALGLAKAAPALALEQASVVLAADPTASDAWIAGLVAADLLGDRARFEALARTLDRDPSPPSALGLKLLGELLARHTGEDGRHALAQALGARP